jgi:hypothetical protein
MATVSSVWPQNRSRRSLGWASKPRWWRVFLVWASKPLDMVWWFGSQNHRDSFLVWVSKSSRLWFVGCATKPIAGCDDVGHASRSSGLLRVEANRARVSQSGLKTVRCTTAGGARVTIAEFMSEESWKRMGQYDGLRRTLLPLLYHFHSLRF